MKVLCFLLSVGVVGASRVRRAIVKQHLGKSDGAQFSSEQPSFEQWAAEYGFNSDDGAMKATYESNVAAIDASNAEHEDFKLGVNKFSGLTVEEFQTTFTGEDDESDDDEIPKAKHMGTLKSSASEVDWSTRSDVVNPVVNQGSCGSCWPFGAIGTLEPRWALKTGKLYKLAEQQLVDCDKSGGSGCDGGLSRRSLSEYYPNKGACTASSYPYKAREGTCNGNCEVVIPAGSVTNYLEVDISMDALKVALQDGPLKVSVYAEDIFMQYKSGIASGGACVGKTNHAVVGVGFGPGYIKIRNSWGKEWGEGGHIRVGDTSSCKSGNFDTLVRSAVYPAFS